jgi:threonine/homoserine/homoserine lactone efflux protein
VSGSEHLWLYFLVVFGVVVLPGMDMAFVLANALTRGLGASLAAIAGVIAGAACHVVLAVLGVAAILQLWPALFNAVLVAGALYVAWLGWGLLRCTEGAFQVVATGDSKTGSVFLQGMLTNVLNPKTCVFMLAIFPQFLKPEQGPLWPQGIALGMISAATQAGVYGSIALLAHRARRWFEASPRANVLIARAVGLALVGTAVLTAWRGWRGI